MSANYKVILELSEEEVAVLKIQYTINVAKIIASELSLEEINELVEKLYLSN